MPGLDPGIHQRKRFKRGRWIAGSSPAMTADGSGVGWAKSIASRRRVGTARERFCPRARAEQRAFAHPTLRPRYQLSLAMPGLDPGIHRKKNLQAKKMDCRVKPGNDSGWVSVNGR
jgi:hypothetical protein